VEVGVSENQDGRAARRDPGELVDEDPTSPSSPRALRPSLVERERASQNLDPSDPMVGRTMAGRYLIEARIGRGGMGLVYRARQVGLERDVVIKVLAAEAIDAGSAHERFVREAQALSMLNHPNIVSIYDFGQDRGQSYIVMEYVDGVRLDTLIREFGHLPLDVFTPIARQMLEALGDAHEMGLMHRDLKPSNVLLTRKREYPYYVKVLDFGLAKMLEDDSKLTGHNALVGSMAYLSPEQILGHAIDQRVDVYALGVLFYTMLSGSKPFVGDQTAVLYKHVHAAPPPLHERLPAGHDVPAALAALIERCLAKDPAKRPAHADDLLDELLRALAGRDVLATPWVTGEYSAAFRAMPAFSGPSSDALIVASPETQETSNQLDRSSVSHLSSSSLSMPRPVVDDDSGVMAVLRSLEDPPLPAAPAPKRAPERAREQAPAPIPHASSSPSLTAPRGRPRAIAFVAAAALVGVLAAFGVMTLFVSPPEAPVEEATTVAPREEPPPPPREAPPAPAAVEAPADATPTAPAEPSPPARRDASAAEPSARPARTSRPKSSPDTTPEPVVEAAPEPAKEKTPRIETKTRKTDGLFGRTPVTGPRGGEREGTKLRDGLLPMK
jgi:serine/threonine protein kinase